MLNEDCLDFFNELYVEKFCIESSNKIQLLKDDFDKVKVMHGTNDIDLTYLFSYYISTISSIDDIILLIKCKRYSLLDASLRVCLEKFSLLRSLYDKFIIGVVEYSKEVNFLVSCEVNRILLSLQRIEKVKDTYIKREYDNLISNMFNHISVLGGIVNFEFFDSSSNIKEGDIIKNIIEKNIGFMQLNVKADRIKKSKIDGDDIFNDSMTKPLNPNNKKFNSGLLLYGDLSLSVHSNLLSTMYSSQDNGEFKFNAFYGDMKFHILMEAVKYMFNELLSMDLRKYLSEE